MIEQCISLYIIYPMLYHVLYYHVYIVYDLNHPRSSKFGRMVKLSSSVSNSNFFWKLSVLRSFWKQTKVQQLTLTAAPRFLLPCDAPRRALIPPLRRCKAPHRTTRSWVAENLGDRRSLEITVNYSGLCMVYVVYHDLPMSTNVYQCLPCLPGNTRWFPDFWYDSWQLLLLCLDCALRCWRRWASQFVSHKSWWGLGVLQVFSWKDWEGIYIDY